MQNCPKICPFSTILSLGDVIGSSLVMRHGKVLKRSRWPQKKKTVQRRGERVRKGPGTGWTKRPKWCLKKRPKKASKLGQNDTKRTQNDAKTIPK